MEGVIQTLVGGLLALAGVWVGPYFQRKHERWKARREDQALLRDKAQELFDELDRVISLSQEASLAAVARIQDDTVVTKQVPDLGRVRAIAAIYFPSSMKLIEEFEAQNLKVSDMVVTQAKEAVEGGKAGLDTLKALPMIMAVKHQEHASSFARQMRDLIGTTVPKVELDLTA